MHSQDGHTLFLFPQQWVLSLGSLPEERVLLGDNLWIQN